MVNTIISMVVERRRGPRLPRSGPVWTSHNKLCICGLNSSLLLLLIQNMSHLCLCYVLLLWQTNEICSGAGVIFIHQAFGSAATATAARLPSKSGRESFEAR